MAFTNNCLGVALCSMPEAVMGVDDFRQRKDAREARREIYLAQERSEHNSPNVQ